MIIEGVIKDFSENRTLDKGVWGIETKTGFLECGDFLAELEKLLNRNNEKGTTNGTNIKISIDEKNIDVLDMILEHMGERLQALDPKKECASRLEGEKRTAARQEILEILKVIDKYQKMKKKYN